MIPRCRSRLARADLTSGSVSIIVLAGSLIMLTGALSLADAGAFLAARARASAAADAAALAAVAAQAPALASRDSPEQAASRVSAANGVTLIECRCKAGETRATVTVEIRPRTLGAMWRGRVVRVTATAEIDPAILTYRGPSSAP